MGFFPENVLGGFSLLGTVPSFLRFIPSFFTEGKNRPELVEVLVDFSPYIWKKAPGCCSYAYTQGLSLSKKRLCRFFEGENMKGGPRFPTEKSAHLS